MSKKLNISLTRSGDIDKCIKYLKDYSLSLDDKCLQFAHILAELGIKVLNAELRNISSFYKGEDISTSGEVLLTDNGWSAVIKMGGSQAIFIEFGAGVTFNGGKGSSKHPLGKKNGFTIGSYNPGSPNATNPQGWWYKNKWGESQHTYGTPTFAPLYTSSLELLATIQNVAKEVFNNG